MYLSLSLSLFTWIKVSLQNCYKGFRLSLIKFEPKYFEISDTKYTHTQEFRNVYKNRLEMCVCVCVCEIREL